MLPESFWAKLPEIRFWSKVDRTSTCWLWTGSKYHFGHGKFWLDGRFQTAHRVVWTWMIGPIPEGMCVLHQCDEPSCVRPSHLFLGTRADNNADRDRKGRTHRKHTRKEVAT